MRRIKFWKRDTRSEWQREFDKEQAYERTSGCCACGQTGHGCNDCPVRPVDGQS